MSTESRGLTDDDRERLTSILRTNQRLGGEPSTPIGAGHPVVDAVRAELPALVAEGKRHYKANEIAARIDEDSFVVGKALALLAEEGIVTRESKWSPAVWRIEEESA